MNTIMKTSTVVPLLGIGLAAAYATQSGSKPKAPELSPSQLREYRTAITKTVEMVEDGHAQSLVQRHGLNLLNVTWEDTGRYKDSSVGPNISDMTIQVGKRASVGDRVEARAMPVIRYPNFTDLTCDLDPRDFTVLVGNQDGKALRRASLFDLLADPSRYLSDPRTWRTNKTRTLLAPGRDSKVLVSAQACFLPVPKQGVATFNPVLFNYQSSPGNPAVLAILATREGTSMTVIDNKRHAFDTGFAWGQRLFHNQNGQRASLTGTRLSDFKGSGSPGPVGERSPDSALNMVLLIQVPLKHRASLRGGFGGGASYDMAPSGSAETKSASRSDTEAAVIGHGEEEGPFVEFDDLPIERDPRFPVRVTVQYYKATSTGVLSEADAAQIKREIDRIYHASDSVGSLVTGGRTGRVTEYDGAKVQPPDWWRQFWSRYESEFGESREDALRKLQQILGRDYLRKPVCDLYLRDLLRSNGSKVGKFGF